MTKKLRKPLSIILSLMMILSVFTIIPVTSASAAEETSTVTWDNNSLQKSIGGKSSGGVTLTTQQDKTRVNDCFYTERGSATFTAPEGSTFTKIELKDCEYADYLNFPGATVAESGGYWDTMIPEDPEWVPYYTVTWTGESSEVTFSGAIYGIQSIVFTLKSTASPTYTVTWNNYDGTELEKDEGVEKDSLPKYDGATPAKAEDSVNTYEFAGWNDGENTYALNEALPQVTDDVTYTATFTATPKTNPDQEAADEVAAMINGITTEVSVNDKEAIEAARAAYDALTDEQKALVDADMLAKLEAAEESLAAAEQAAADQAAADEVVDAFNALPTEVTVDDKDAIEAARAAYDALTDEQKQLVDSEVLARLVAAEEALAAAVQAAADQAAADDVTAMINNLPAEVTANDAQDITAAREAYNNLTNDQKALIDADTLAKLETAEAALEAATRTYDKVNANDADCTANGNIEYYVGSDGKFYSDDQGTPLDDLNNDGVVDINDTIIPATPHEYVETIVQPKNGEPGYLLHTCSNCNDSYKDNYFNDPLKNTSRIETEGKVGEAVNLYGAAEGGVAGYTYAFLYRKCTTETWTKIGKKYGTATSAKFTPGKATKYIIMINVKDSIGKVKSKTFTLDLSNPLVNNTTVNAETVAVGEKIVLKGAASGGIVGGTKGYKYAFYYKKSKSTEWLPMVDEYTTKSAAFRPKKATSYDVMSVVKDSEGKTDIKSFTVNVTAAE